MADRPRIYPRGVDPSSIESPMWWGWEEGNKLCLHLRRTKVAEVREGPHQAPYWTARLAATPASVVRDVVFPTREDAMREAEAYALEYELSRGDD